MIHVFLIVHIEVLFLQFFFECTAFGRGRYLLNLHFRPIEMILYVDLTALITLSIHLG